MFVLLYFTPLLPNALFYKIFVIIVMVEYVLYICIFVSIYEFPKKKYLYKNGVKISIDLEPYMYIYVKVSIPHSDCEVEYIINIQVIIFS